MNSLRICLSAMVLQIAIGWCWRVLLEWSLSCVPVCFGVCWLCLVGAGKCHWLLLNCLVLQSATVGCWALCLLLLCIGRCWKVPLVGVGGCCTSCHAGCVWLALQITIIGAAILPSAGTCHWHIC